MNLNPFKWFKKTEEEPDIDFRDTTARAFEDFPPRLAREVPIYFKEDQKKNLGKFSFAECPGMWDYSQYGYIITAPDTVMIKANRAGTIAMIKRRHGQNQSCATMNADLINGYFKYEGIPPNAFKIDLPWRIICKKNISAFLLPAYYHSSFLEHVHVVPGMVDYQNFWTISFIFAIKKECEVTIKAGEPILHILPYWNKPIRANYGMIEVEQMAPTMTAGFDSISQYYRKKYNVKKIFNLGKSGEEK